MTEQELKEKIKKVLDEAILWRPYYAISRGIVYESDLDNIADALIAAGLKFDVNYSFTAAFNNAQAERERDLEHSLTLTERRVDIAEKSFDLVYEEASRYMRLSTKEWYREMAKNIVEEKQ